MVVSMGGIFLEGQNVAASDHSLKETLKKLEQTYRSIQDFQSDFEQIESNPILNREKKSQGVIYSLPKGRVFWHTTEPSPLKVISDGETIWLFYPRAGSMLEGGQLFEEKWGKLDSQTKIALLFLRREGNLREHFNIRWQNPSERIIELSSKHAIGIEKIWLFLSSELFGAFSEKRIFFKKIIFFFPLNRKSELIFKNIKFNQQIWARHQKRSLDQNIDASFRFVPLEKIQGLSK